MTYKKHSHSSIYFLFFQMSDPTIVKQCRRVNVSFFNTQGSGRRRVRICVSRQNGSETITAQFLDTGINLTTANLLDKIQIQ